MEPSDIRPAIITNSMKMIMTFIDRIGFPILAFLGMWYLNYRLSESIDKFQTTLAEIKQIIILRER